MQLISERLLEIEIKKYESKQVHTDSEEFFYMICRKELALFKKLRIEGVDMCGECDEVDSRLERQALYFMDKAEFDTLEKKAAKYDGIASIVAGEL